MARKFAVQTQDRKFTAFKEDDEKRWKEPFFFIQAADTQLGMQEKFVERIRDYGWSKELDWCRRTVQDVNAMSPRPKFVVVCGDLLDAWPDSEGTIRTRQEEDFKSVFAELEVPLVCVCGNHDIGNQPTHHTVSKYRSSFGDDFFSFWCGGVFFIVTNTQYYEDATFVPTLAVEHDSWLEEQLEYARRMNPRHTVVFQHIPPFLKDPTEEKMYFNMDISLRYALLERFHNAGIRHVFCGHYHRNAGGFYKDLELVVTSAIGAQLGESKNGYRVVKVLSDCLEHQYYEIGSGPRQVDLSVESKTATEKRDGEEQGGLRPSSAGELGQPS
ncbi:serine/threonine-protein phosphatase CPPED1-like [Oratosquilla oratoria]|uniref:serine/threonine-protein phosphatase CPPED1-like n=1 Tax=Oratosquilla oratoria TaxID=337810 RepID=UPI003F757763